MSTGRDPRFPPGWWIVPALLGSAFVWLRIAAVIHGYVAS